MLFSFVFVSFIALIAYGAMWIGCGCERDKEQHHSQQLLLKSTQFVDANAQLQQKQQSFLVLFVFELLIT